MGVGLLAVASAYSIGSGVSLPYWPEEAREGFAANVMAAVAGDDRGGARRHARAAGSTSSRHRSAGALAFETLLLITWGLWRAGGLMLIGMALFKREVFAAPSARRASTRR